MANLGWPVVAILAVCMVVGQICFIATQYTLARWSYTSPIEQQKSTCAGSLRLGHCFYLLLVSGAAIYHILLGPSA